MKYALLGNTGLVVSRLGFGALTFTQGNQSIQSVYKVDTNLARTMVERAIEAGINLFDTADVYADGESERSLGAALKPHRDKVVITTKVGNRGADRSVLRAGLSKRHILWSVDQSLRRLDTDWIDLYVLHREDPHTPLEETLSALDSVVRSGKVRYLGFSNWSAWKAAAAIEIQKANGYAPFTHGQMYYSLLGRDVERDVLPMMQRYGLGMTVYSPLAFGFLSGAYTRADLDRPDNRYSNFDMLRIDREQGFALIERMRRIAQAHAASVAQLAIAWTLARPGVDSVLLGASKLHQLDDNLGALALQLSEADLAELDAATAITPLYPSSNWIAPDRLTARALKP